MIRHVSGVAILVVLLASTNCAVAGIVLLQNATATYSQTLSGDWLVARAIDGQFDTSFGSGWSIARENTNSSTQTETAVFETASDLGGSAGVMLTFKLHHLFNSPGQHNIGRFRLSATADSRAEFADGLSTGGDVTANWTVLDPLSATSTGGTVLNQLDDYSVLATGINPSISVYTVTAQAFLTGITGFRLEVLEDPSLPNHGPGRSTSANFVLTEFQVEATALAVPEPSTRAMVVGTGFFVGFLRTNRRRRSGGVLATDRTASYRRSDPVPHARSRYLRIGATRNLF